MLCILFLFSTKFNIYHLSFYQIAIDLFFIEFSMFRVFDNYLISLVGKEFFYLLLYFKYLNIYILCFSES